MSKQQILHVYKAGLRLYPKGFRQEYAQQMLLTAQDALFDARTKTETLRVIGRLTIDLFFTVIKENSNKLGGTMKNQFKTTKTSALSAAVLGLQIVGISCLTYICLMPISFFFASPPPYKAEFWYVGLIAPLVPIVLILLAGILLRGASRLSLWSRIVWAYGLGFGGIVCYYLFGTIVDSLRRYYYPQLFSYADSTNVLQIYWHDWLIVTVFLVGFSWAITKFAQRFKSTSKINNLSQ